METHRVRPNEPASVLQMFAGAAAPAATTVCPATGSTGAYSWTYSGYTTTATDPAGVQRVNNIDGLGRLSAVTESGDGISTCYSYDAMNHLTGVLPDATSVPCTTAANRTFGYDSLGRLSTATNPETGTTPIQYSYDRDGNMTGKSDGNNIPTAISYDQLNRPTLKSYTCANASNPTACAYLSSTVTYSYDQNLAITGSNPTSALQISNGNSSTIYRYEALGRVQSSQQQTAGTNYVFDYTWYPVGMATETYPTTGRTITYSYDAAGRINGVSGELNGGAATNYAQTVSYAPQGAVSGITFGNNLTEATIFNADLRPKSIATTALAGTQLLSFVYGYSPAADNGNVLSQTITRWDPFAQATQTWNQTYTYDGLNRLSTAAEAASANTSANGSPWMQTFGYDYAGNRWLAANAGNQSQPYSPSNEAPQAGAWFGSNNQIVQTGWSYDDAGNILNFGGVRTATYDAENRMATSSQAGIAETYGYDGDGRRVTKTGAAGTTVYVYDAVGELATEIPAVLPATGGTTYLSVDALGSTRLVTDGVGNQLELLDYLPFGEQAQGGLNGRNSVLWAGTEYTAENKFTGKERDAESGLDYFGARYMSSAQGRFTSPDPKQFSLRTLVNPQKWNKYSYTLNNPLALVDPDGKEEVTVTVRAFIPESNFRFPPVIGPTWRGDGRSFDANATRYRVQGQITIETDPSVRANPIVSAQGSTSGSAVNWWGLGSSQDATKVNLSAVGSRDANGNPIVNMSVSGSDPLAPGAPPAAATLTIGLPTNGSQISVGGTITPYPAWEIYATPQGGSPTTVLQVPTSPQTNSPAALFLGQSQTIYSQKPLPSSDDCKKTGTCSQPQ